MQSRLEGGYVLPGQADLLFGYEEILSKVMAKPLILLSSVIQDYAFYKPKTICDIEVKSIFSYNNSFDQLIKDLEHWKKQNYRILLLSSSTTRAKRLAENIKDYGLLAYFAADFDRTIAPGEIMVASGRLGNGFEYPTLKFVVLSEKDIFKERKAKKPKKKSQYSGQKINSLSEISVGDYVVHEKYGLGIYRGMEKIESDGITKDYINIEYKDASNLFVPASQLELIQKYSNLSARKPKLNKLGGTEWEKTKSRVRSQVQIAAQDLVKLYAERQAKEGYAYGKDTVWQKEFEELFPYEETEDQLSAIEDTKRDMESHRIMDRLICGDVGYGKTEVAIRAAFKAVMDSKQVVYLVPTTILARAPVLSTTGASFILISVFTSAPCPAPDPCPAQMPFSFAPQILVSPTPARSRPGSFQRRPTSALLFPRFCLTPSRSGYLSQTPHKSRIPCLDAFQRRDFCFNFSKTQITLAFCCTL